MGFTWDLKGESNYWHGCKDWNILLEICRDRWRSVWIRENEIEIGEDWWGLVGIGV